MNEGSAFLNSFIDPKYKDTSFRSLTSQAYACLMGNVRMSSSPWNSKVVGSARVLR
jgi:hypothetical protein